MHQNLPHSIFPSLLCLLNLYVKTCAGAKVPQLVCLAVNVPYKQHFNSVGNQSSGKNFSLRPEGESEL
jgi:hypothetical protein